MSEKKNFKNGKLQLRIARNREMKKKIITNNKKKKNNLPATYVRYRPYVTSKIHFCDCSNLPAEKVIKI